MPIGGIFGLKSWGICLFFGHFHQNCYYFHHRNHHFHYQNQFEFDSVIRAKMSFLAAGKKDHLARLGEGGGGLSLTSFGFRPLVRYRRMDQIWNMIQPKKIQNNQQQQNQSQ